MIDKELDNEILNYILDENHKMIPSRTSAKMLTKKGYYAYLVDRFVDNTTDSVQEILHRLVNNIEDVPTCPMCGKRILFSLSNRNYPGWCSAKCRNNSDNVKTKNKVGVSKSLKTVYGNNKQAILERRSKRLNEIYGADINSGSPFSIKEVRDRSKETLNARYGVDNVFSLEEYRDTKENIRERSVVLWKERGLDIEYNGDNVIVHNGCTKHGDVELSLGDFNNRTKAGRINVSVICPICNPLRYNSGEEDKLKEFLDSYGINYIMHDRNVIKPYELDFYIPDRKMAIEMNGLFYHSESGGKDKTYHKMKSELCESAGIQLLHIWEYDWVNKNDIVLSILKSKLGLIERRIFARKCVCKCIDIKTAKEFCERNHLQGYVQSKYKFGLYYGDELVSVMTFGKCRSILRMKDEFDSCELYRFCNVLNSEVIGGASKLLKYSLDYLRFSGIKTIMTFAKRDMSVGNVYAKLGFVREGVTEPNYFYCNIKGEKLNRYSCMKHKLASESDNLGLTECEIMKRRGFYKCYDSGNIKYKYCIK